MRSSFPRLTSLMWAPALGCAGLVAYHCAGTYYFLYQFAWMMAQLDGAQWRSPETDQRKARVVGGLGAAGVASGTFFGFKAALDRILLPKAPSRTRLFDVLTAEDRTQQPLTLKRIWTLLGPSATPASWRQFGRTHGWQSLSIFLSGMWAVLITPLAHGKIEASMCAYGEPAPPEKRQRMLSELQRRLDDARSGRKSAASGNNAAGANTNKQQPGGLSDATADMVAIANGSAAANPASTDAVPSSSSALSIASPVASLGKG